MIAGDTEEGIYNALGLTYVEPEMREDVGELELAQNHKLPVLVDYDAMKGDMQMHTNWSDGANTIEELAYAAMALGLEYIVITDHTKRLTVANGLDEAIVDPMDKDLMNSMITAELLLNKFIYCDSYLTAYMKAL